MNPSARILLSLSVALSASACSGKPGDSASSGATTSGEGEGEGEGELPANAADAVATYAQIVSATYEDSLTAASRLDSAIDAFLAKPGSTAASPTCRPKSSASTTVPSTTPTPAPKA
jgi:uncharacterized iron-regulated protein